MSRKLATTIKDSAIPGKYKRVLEAYAAFANNDGTNIRPSQRQLGVKAGVSPDTIQRCTPALIASGILRHATSHTCKVSSCNKGATHFTGTWGRWTLVYNLDISWLQSAVNYLSEKCGEVNAAKCRKPVSRKLRYDSGIKPLTPALDAQALGMNPNSSALTSGSEVASEGADDSLRSSSRYSTSQAPQTSNLQTDQVISSEAKQEQKQNQPQDVLIHWGCSTLSGIWLKRTGKPFTASENTWRLSFGYGVVEAVLDITLNKREKSAKMVWRRFQVFADNWQTNYDLSMAWTTVKKAKKEHPRGIPAKFDCSPMTPEEEKSSREYFCANCKVGDWNLSADEWKATGASAEHLAAALRFCCNNCRQVTKAQFVDLLIEAMGSVTIEALLSATGKTGVSFSDLCPDCGWEHADCTCVGKAKAVVVAFTKEEIASAEQELRAQGCAVKTKAVAAGKGFEPEEAE
jgi:hypothetical protein